MSAADVLAAIPANISVDAAYVEQYSWKMCCSAVLSVIANMLAFYLILWHSPKSMAAYRWCLLDISASSLLFDLHITLVYQPLPLFPTPVTCTIGVARRLPPFFGTVAQAMTVTYLMGFCVAAIVNAFMFRLLSIYNRAHWMRKRRAIALVCAMHLMCTLPAAILLGRASRDDDLTRQYLKATSLQLDCLVVVRPFLGFCTVVCEVVFWLSIIAALPYLSFRKLRQLERDISLPTLRNHRQLLVCLIVQILLPSVVFAIPAIILAIYTVADLPGAKVLLPLSFQVFTMHSTLNAVVMIAVTRPYRDAVFKFVRPWTLRKHVASRVSGQGTTDVVLRVQAASQQRRYSVAGLRGFT